jgi:hypothetical protein
LKDLSVSAGRNWRLLGKASSMRICLLLPQAGFTRLADGIERAAAGGQLGIDRGTDDMLAAFQKHKPPVVICPGCHKPMTAGKPEPILFAKGLADITYICEKCGTKTKRTVKEK